MNARLHTLLSIFLSESVIFIFALCVMCFILAVSLQYIFLYLIRYGGMRLSHRLHFCRRLLYIVHRFIWFFLFAAWPSACIMIIEKTLSFHFRMNVSCLCGKNVRASPFDNFLFLFRYVFVFALAPMIIWMWLRVAFLEASGQRTCVDVAYYDYTELLLNS